MSFPYHDRFWTDTADFLKLKVQPKDKILAPDQFWWLFGSIYRYSNTTLNPDFCYEWVIIHKGELHKISTIFLENISNHLIPVFANEVFVIWSANKNLEILDSNTVHLKAFFEMLALASKNDPEVKIKDKEPVLPDQGKYFTFAELSDSELQEAMDRFWRNGGYRYETLRDRTYYAEIDRYISEFIGDGKNQTILDLCCGKGRLSKIILKSQKIIGIDISKVAIEIARSTHTEQKEFEFQVMDAHNLDFPANTFDTVLFIDAIEHVKDVMQVFAQISKVIKPNGNFLLTVANKNSLNQIINRKLGYQEFVTNYQHIKEFSFQEISKLLCKCGFILSKTAGILLFPYWGIPGIDEVVREITDNDPEVVEITRILGERAGSEYAYAFVVLAKKQANIS